SRPLDPSTLTTSTFTLQRPDGSTVVATPGYSAATNSATLTPAAPLTFSTTYTATLTTGVKASDGLALAQDVSWPFTTQPAPLASAMTWTFDTTSDGTAPETTIATAPVDPSSSTAPSFQFTSSEANSTFECALDTGAFVPCASPFIYPNVVAGIHTFLVRATD